MYFSDRYKTDEILYQWRAVNPVEFGSDRDSTMSRFHMTEFRTGRCDMGFSTGQEKADNAFDGKFGYPSRSIYKYVISLPCLPDSQ